MQDNPNVKVLAEQDGFSLLLVTTTMFTQETGRYVIAVKAARATELLEKEVPNTLDFERHEVICLLGDREVTEKILQDAIFFFKRHFLVNERMKRTFEQEDLKIKE